MRTTLDIDEKLLEEAVKLSGARTKKGAIEEALSEYVNARRREWLISRFGKGDIDLTVDGLWKMRGCDEARAETAAVRPAGDASRLA